MAVTRPKPPGNRQRKPRPPLNPARLDELALHYVSRFATSRAKLATYLGRKVRERGWDSEDPADISALVERLSRLGYVDDRAFALSKARSLTARGYGGRRVGQALHVAGIGEEDGGDARALANSEAIEAALHFARRRRLGPFASVRVEAKERDRAIAAMIRAGHRFGLAQAIIDLAPGDNFDAESLAIFR